MEQTLERAGLISNKSTTTFDSEKPAVTSEIRAGSSVGTTRGFDEVEFRCVGERVVGVSHAPADKGAEGDPAVEREVLSAVKDLWCRFPSYEWSE